MKTGRKPKPTALKLLEGNPGRRNLSKPAPVFDSDKPSPPPFLNNDALQEWHRLIDILFETGVMTETDRAAFAAYCQSYGRWVQAERQIAKLQEKNELNGFLIKTKEGNIIQQPLVGIANKAKADMVRFAAEFGMTPSSRARIEITGTTKKENPFARNGNRPA